MSSPQFTLYSHKGPGPNPPKVALLLEWLNLSYEIVPRVFGDGPNGVKAPDFLALNPNGRVPALVDHGNNDFTVWESGACLIYLADKYDQEGRFYGKTAEERALTAQWLTYQLSGLGPSQGQVNWLIHYFESASGVKAQPEMLKRFRDETDRLYKILDGQLARQAKAGSQYIVHDRITIADFAFYGWVRIIHMAKFELSDYPNVQKWADNLANDERTKKAYAKLE
ncbi:unnamed protein product [Tilletia controversa]|uniref:Glutathione S-transferase n=3 Tax=Tilletia TaxID=13289 RepID=A0A8X7N015_9BASI|nr:hypothetical protein CF335_g4430 [Tilletia laevis]KAE8201444.1 hypothetical protein CF328_g2670 [Tilletia controversa]KAE8258529.1 hypothetical protein A4X03_0g4352 [Tilletia caries]KAE8198421.1 hypothetical protein CF336_g1691 [Tilletia laevis]KAE8253876.1 hypothetical protein A4X06_0g1171 [Tilletia controversa]